MLPVTLISRPRPVAAKHPQNIKLPPLCFKVGMVFLGKKALPDFLKTEETLLWLNNSIFSRPTIEHALRRQLLYQYGALRTLALLSDAKVSITESSSGDMLSNQLT